MLTTAFSALNLPGMSNNNQPSEKSKQRTPEQAYSRTFRLLITENKLPPLVSEILQKEGHTEREAVRLIKQVQQKTRKAPSPGGKRDIVIGGLWCAGGTILTVADFGLIFWGAILFGAFQMVRGYATMKGWID